MKRGDARELAVHLIYGRAFTGEEPEQVVSTRLNKEYYEKLAEENEVYAQRPDRFQLRYIDSVVTGGFPPGHPGSRAQRRPFRNRSGTPVGDWLDLSGN